MAERHTLLKAVACAAAVFGTFCALPAVAGDAVDLGEKVLDPAAIKEGLFPEDSCKELEASGFKCMGIKPATRYALPAAAFKLGSAELPDRLKSQLDSFAEVLKSERDSGRVIRIEGHTDATGTDAVNQALSQRRAEAVRSYLIDHGASAQMLVAIGVGAKDLKVSDDPTAAANRRVEIGRQN